MRQQTTATKASVAALLAFVGGCAGHGTTGTSPPPSIPVTSPPSLATSAGSSPQNWWTVSSGTPSAPPWREPTAYRFVIEAGCNRGPSMGTFSVEVANGRITRSTRLQPARPAEGAVVRTLGALIDDARKAQKSGGESVLVQDPQDGHPVIVTFNMSHMDLDGAVCYKVSDYVMTVS